MVASRGSSSFIAKGKLPVAFLSRASVSDAVKARIEAGDTALELKDWRSGKNVVVVDCVSPFNAREVFVGRFLAGMTRPGQTPEAGGSS